MKGNIAAGFLLGVLMVSIAFAATALRPQDFDADTFKGGVIVDGLNILGSRADEATVRSLDCPTHPSPNCFVTAADTATIFLSTGPLGAWISQKDQTAP